MKLTTLEPSDKLDWISINWSNCYDDKSPSRLIPTWSVVDWQSLAIEWFFTLTTRVGFSPNRSSWSYTAFSFDIWYSSTMWSFWRVTIIYLCIEVLLILIENWFGQEIRHSGWENQGVESALDMVFDTTRGLATFALIMPSMLSNRELYTLVLAVLPHEVSCVSKTAFHLANSSQ